MEAKLGAKGEMTSETVTSRMERSAEASLERLAEASLPGAAGGMTQEREVDSDSDTLESWTSTAVEALTSRGIFTGALKSCWTGFCVRGAGVGDGADGTEDPVALVDVEERPLDRDSLLLSAGGGGGAILGSSSKDVLPGGRARVAMAAAEIVDLEARIPLESKLATLAGKASCSSPTFLGRGEA